MLHRYTDLERIAIRNKYGSCPLMKVAETACHLFDSQLQNISLWPEELFVWSAVIMDDVKENGDEYMIRIGDLWKEHYRELRSLDKSVPKEELQLASSLILYVPILMLQTSKDSVHRYMGKQMLDSVSMNYEEWEKSFTDIAARCNRLAEGVGSWTNYFMALDNDLYLSDEVADLLAPLSQEAPDSANGAGTVVNVTVQSGGEYVQQKTVERSIGKVEAGGTGFAEQPKEK